MNNSSVQEETPPLDATQVNGWQKWRPSIEVLIGLLALTPILLFLIASLGRLRYPFPLEQLEGSMLLGAERVAQGVAIYVRPNFHFIPYMYGPIYYYVSGWAVRLMGSSFLPLRLVSLLSTFASFAIIYFFVLLEATGTRRRRHLAALSAAGLYAAAYPWTREWFDLGRLDSLYVLLLLVALLCTRRLHPVLAAAAWTLTFLTKQTILPVAVIMLCHDWKRPRRVLLGVGSFLLLAAVSTGWIDHATGGWFRFYIFIVPRANADLILRPITSYLPSEMIAPFGVALLIVLTAFARAQFSVRNSKASFYLLAGISIVGLCWFLQAHAGASRNTPMPAYAVLAVLFGISFDRLDTGLALKASRESARIFLLGLVAIPLISWIYYPHDFMPQRPLLNSHQQTEQWLHSFSGDVFLPSNSYEAVAAGKQWHPDLAALHDALRPNIPEIRKPLLNEIHAEIDREQFDAIAFDVLPSQALAEQSWLPSDLERHYPIVGIVPGGTVTDPFAPRPSYFLLPCREQALAASKGWTLLQSGSDLACPSPSKPQMAQPSDIQRD